MGEEEGGTEDNGGKRAVVEVILEVSRGWRRGRKTVCVWVGGWLDQEGRTWVERVLGVGWLR